MPPLDELAARGVARARLFERAVHDPGPWFVHWGGQVAPASREEDPDAGTVTLAAAFHLPCTGPAALYCRDEPMSWSEIAGQFPSDGFEIAFILGGLESVAA